jgi:hypothetical protein
MTSTLTFFVAVYPILIMAPYIYLNERKLRAMRGHINDLLARNEEEEPAVYLEPRGDQAGGDLHIGDSTIHLRAIEYIALEKALSRESK